MGVDEFVGLEVALKVGAGEIPAADVKSFACGESGEYAEGWCTEGAGPVLIVVSAGNLEVALYDESSFESAVAFDFEHPQHWYGLVVVRDLGCEYG